MGGAYAMSAANHPDLAENALVMMVMEGGVGKTPP
jgi:hypothetical protein